MTKQHEYMLNSSVHRHSILDMKHEHLESIISVSEMAEFGKAKESAYAMQPAGTELSVRPRLSIEE